jgi:DNA-binding CsgD family transcriptional regulator
MASLSDPFNQLTPRQKDIVRLSYTGYSFDDIARSLRITPNTLRWHTTQVRRVYPAFRCGGTPQRSKLTHTEKTVLQLVAAGLDNRAIRQRLQLSVHTVNKHLSNLYNKMGVANRIDLVRTALVVQNVVLIGESEATYA